MQTRIVTIGSTGTASVRTEPYNFDEVISDYVNFDENYSEARGRGRARRKARKLERIANRREVRKARQEARKEKQQGRISNRAERQRARQEKRTSNMQMRQDRRKQRKQLRMDRKAIGDEPNADMDDTTATEMDDQNSLPPNEDDGSYGNSGGGYVGGGNSGGGSGSTIYAQDEDQAPNMDEDYTYDDEQGDYSGGEEQGYDESDSEGSYDESGFDGQGKSMNAKFLLIAKKIEWNKELILRLEFKKVEFGKLLSKTPVGPRAEKLKNEIVRCDSEIAERKQRIAVLENMLLSASNFSGASGQVSRAKKMARKLRGKITMANSNRGNPVGGIIVKGGKNPGGQMRAMMMRNHGGDVTPVDSDLNPDFRQNYIKIPAKMSNLDGTGIIAIDDMDAYDADEPRTFEVKSSADGELLKPGITLNKVIAVGLAGLIIYAVVKSLTKK
jgi:hypothetical protein